MAIEINDTVWTKTQHILLGGYIEASGEECETGLERKSNLKVCGIIKEAGEPDVYECLTNKGIVVHMGIDDLETI